MENLNNHRTITKLLYKEQQDEVRYLDQELLVSIKNLIDDINDSKLHHLRECASLIHDINNPSQAPEGV